MFLFRWIFKLSFFFVRKAIKLALVVYIAIFIMESSSEALASVKDKIGSVDQAQVEAVVMQAGKQAVGFLNELQEKTS